MKGIIFNLLEEVIERDFGAEVWEAPIAQLATLQSADIILPTTDGREIRLRRVATPTPEQQQFLDQLDISVPAHLEWNAECSADFVTS